MEVVRYDKYRKIKDYFGLWDLICVNNCSVRFVQVKSNKKPPREWVDRALEWGSMFGADITKEYVVYKDYARGVKPGIIHEL